ncbi:uncharacterized protein J3R85_004478 [Psidium guajava]|nr:uncharacterized protein J3R85_004478 [Psidium guajava]
MPENAVLHEQKAQLLLEIGDAWGALKTAISGSQILLLLLFPHVFHQMIYGVLSLNLGSP